MSIPNTIVKIINKYGRIVDFDIEKIIRSVTSAILDTGDQRAPELRARKYAKEITDRVYREFYDQRWLKTDFIVKYLNYKPDERESRLDNATVTFRLTFILFEKYKEMNPGKPPDTDKINSFVQDELKNAAVSPDYTDGLFPRLTGNEIGSMSEFLTKKISGYYTAEFTDVWLYPTREYIQDMLEKELKDIGEIEIAEAYMIYREGRKKIHEEDIGPLQFTNNGIHHELVNRITAWNIDHSCDSIFSLNNWIKSRGGRDPGELIELSEKRYLDDVLGAVKLILERKSEIKIVIIAGPSCSNKTTTTVIIGQELRKHGLKLKALNVDNYFKNLADQPKDEFGDYDFEMPEAIDMDLLNDNLEHLLRGETVKLPHYDFKSGVRDGYEEFHIEEDEIILIDCLHGLYRKLTSSVPPNKKFRIYIESMNIIRNIEGKYTRWSDIRMLKRMIRDSQHRGYSTKHTLAHWPYVRKGELKHIIPYIFSTDIVLNSGMPYELPVLKKSLEGKLPGMEYIKKLRMEGRLDPYIRGMRMLHLVETVADLETLDIVPSHSPLREFIGGSAYLIPHND